VTIGQVAFEHIIDLPGLTANADLSDAATHPGQYCFVAMAADKKVGLCGDDGKAVGVLLNKPTSGGACAIAGPGSICKAYAYGTITYGQKLTTSAYGMVVATSESDDPVVATCLQGASSGDLALIRVEDGLTLNSTP
jgi:hypothetical protein